MIAPVSVAAKSERYREYTHVGDVASDVMPTVDQIVQLFVFDIVLEGDKERGQAILSTYSAVYAEALVKVAVLVTVATQYAGRRLGCCVKHWNKHLSFHWRV